MSITARCSGAQGRPPLSQVRSALFDQPVDGDHWPMVSTGRPLATQLIEMHLVDGRPVADTEIVWHKMTP